MFGDEPDWFFCGHPVAIVKSRQVHRTRITSESAFAAQVEVNIKITHRELAQSAVHRFTIAAAGEIGFRHRAPVLAQFENRHDMIGVLFRFQVEDQRRETDYAQRGRGKYSSLET